MNKDIQLSVHLGAHKTATTHLQRSIDDSAEAAIDAGVRCYGPQYLRHGGRAIQNLFGLKPWCGNAKPRRTPESQLEFLSKGSKRVFLSDENFLGPLHQGDGNLVLPVYADAPERVAALAAALPDARIKLYLAIRSPDTFIESSYSQTLFSGHFLAPEEFKAKHPLDSVDWVPLVRGLANAPGIESLMVWRYEDYGQIFNYLMRRMLRWKLGTVIEPFHSPLHPGLSVAAVQQIIDWRVQGRGGPLASMARRDLPVNADNPRFALFQEDEKAAARRSYDAQIQEICGIEKCEFVDVEELPSDLR
jgi:hypothetical protein